MEQERYYITSNNFSLQDRTTASKGKVYDVVFRVYTMEGTPKQKWLRGYKSKTLAKTAYMRFVDDCCEFVWSNPSKAKNKAKETLYVGDLVRQYLAALGNQNKRSVIYDKDKIMKHFILPKYKDTPIEKLTKEELTIWQDELWRTKNQHTGQYLSYNYLNKIRTQFNTFLTWVQERYSTPNNFASVKKPPRRQPKTEMKFWTREQFEQFISVVDNETYKALFSFLFYTGRRKGEIFALYKTDIHGKTVTFDKSVSRRTYRAATWEITTTKEEKTCTLPVCKPIQEIIQTYKPPEDGLFYFGGKEPLAPTTVDRAFKKYTALAGLPHIRMHDLRHSFVSMLIHYGANFAVVADLISDTIEQVTKTYGHLYIEDRNKVIEMI